MTNPTRFQFGLRTLFGIVTLCAVVLGVGKALGLEVVLGLSGLAWSCGFVLLLALALVPLDRAVSRLGNWASFVFASLLFCGIAFAFLLLDAAVNQPHLFYLNDRQVRYEWLARALVSAATALPLTAVVTLLPVVIHMESRTSHPRDRAYYPRLANVWRGLGLLRVRLILIVGSVLVLGYYAGTIMEVQSAQRVCGIVWPPPRVWISCHLLWGLLWLADCTSRPNRGMVKVAVGYLCIAVLFLLLFGFDTMGA